MIPNVGDTVYRVVDLGRHLAMLEAKVVNVTTNTIVLETNKGETRVMKRIYLGQRWANTARKAAARDYVFFKGIDRTLAYSEMLTQSEHRELLTETHSDLCSQVSKLKHDISVLEETLRKQPNYRKH